MIVRRSRLLASRTSTSVAVAPPDERLWGHRVERAAQAATTSCAPALSAASTRVAWMRTRPSTTVGAPRAPFRR